ncbi:hypothetical protein ACFYPC_10925 [Streptomyces sp. NPDC005808]|uniref:hypothetical protein n=1 Tax=Streptomyces sp. NPDC005808 TaxID=3364734 RepID=UPI0036ABBE60
MSADTSEISVSLFIDVRISLLTGNVVARFANASSDAQDRLLLAGLGPLRSVAPRGNAGLLLENARGEQWLVDIAEASGLVASVEHVHRPQKARQDLHIVSGPATDGVTV